MSLNQNNFLRWTGATTYLPYSIYEGGGSATLYSNQDSIIVLPLDLSSASNGIDPTSFLVESVIDLYQALEYNYLTRELTVFRPLDMSVTSFEIRFSFYDYSGNKSPVGTFTINVSSIVVQWVQYPVSASCTIDIFGVNNGFLSWSQLKLVNQSTGTDISPLTLKDNISSDPDYIAPVTDLITCPVPSGGTYAPLIISNFSLNGANPAVDFIVITQITIACSSCGTGGSPLLLNIPCSIQPGETARFNIPAIAWDTGLTISYTVNSGGDMTSAPNQVYWKSQSVGVVDNFPSGAPSPVTNAGVFGNFQITVTPIYGLTIFCR